LEELAGQTHRVREARRQRGRAVRGARVRDADDESTVDDPDLERRIRSATGGDPVDEEDA
ncbi:MAG: hypothetical protein ACREDE_04850, partial [Thermoplasmata archaeon]